eukprot:5967315-Amphidinium_carterae.1
MSHVQQNSFKSLPQQGVQQEGAESFYCARKQLEALATELSLQVFAADTKIDLMPHFCKSCLDLCVLAFLRNHLQTRPSKCSHANNYHSDCKKEGANKWKGLVAASM